MITLVVVTLLSVGRLMAPSVIGQDIAPPPVDCGATSCITTETGADLQTEGASNLITEP